MTGLTPADFSSSVTRSSASRATSFPTSGVASSADDDDEHLSKVVDGKVSVTIFCIAKKISFYKCVASLVL